MTMKYIRTKDEKIIKILKEGIDDFGKYGMVDEENCIRNYDDLKQTNTIEELFDEFRGVWINYYESENKDAHEEYHYDKEKNVFYNDFEELTSKEAIEKFDIFYGAIWTNKGLIYKAKMKDVLSNGEIDWELL